MSTQQSNEMPPALADLWENVTHERMDIAELKGMIKMHFREDHPQFAAALTAAQSRFGLSAAETAAILEESLLR